MLSRIGPTQEPQSSDDITVTLGDVKKLGRAIHLGSQVCQDAQHTLRFPLIARATRHSKICRLRFLQHRASRLKQLMKSESNDLADLIQRQKQTH